MFSHVHFGFVPLDDALASCPPEEIFLCRLLRSGYVDKNRGSISVKAVQEALSLRHSAIVDLMKHLQEAIAARLARNELLASALHGNLSSEGLELCSIFLLELVWPGFLNSGKV